MIKQTSGAISFLLAAYRAILKKNFLLALIAAASLSASTSTLAYTLTQDKEVKANDSGIEDGSVNHLTRDDEVVIKSDVTLKITTNAKLDTDYVKNEGRIELTNGSVLGGSTIQNMGTINVDHSSFIHDDIVNHGTVEIKGTSDEKTYIFDGSTYINNAGTFTLDHVKQVGSPASGEDGKYNVTTSSKTNGSDSYTSYELTKDASGKTLNQIFGSGEMAEDGEGSTLMVFVNGGTFNIKNSELMTAQGDDDGYWDENNSASGYADVRDEYGNDQSASVQPGLLKPAHEKKLSEILGQAATCTEANHKAAIEKLKLQNPKQSGEDDDDYLERLEGMLYEGTTYSELVVSNGTLNIENSTTYFNYATQKGGTINVTDSKLYTYDGGVLNFEKGTLNIKATGEGTIAGSSDHHSEVGYVDSATNKGSIIKVGKSATVTFEGKDDNALAIINAKSLTNEGTFEFKNKFYKINTLSEAFDFNNSGTANIDAATTDNLKTTNLKNAGNGILNIKTGADSQVEIKSIASTGGIVNARDSNIKTSDVTLSGNTKAEFGTLESSGTIAVGSATAGAAQVHIDKLVAGKIQADPDWSSPSLVSVATMGTDGTTTVDNISAGRNSAVVFGSSSNAEASSLVSQAGGLSEGRTQAMLYLNKALKVKSGTGITIDGTQENPTVSADTLTLGKNSALVLGERIVTAALKTDVDGSSGSDTAALTFENGAGTVNYTDSSKVILDTTGAQIGQTYRIFENTTTLTNSDGTSNGLYLTSRNNNVKATIGSDGVTTALEQNYTRDTLKAMSASVYEAADAAMHGGSGNGINFLSSVVGNSLRYGQEAESAARLAQFGGVYQNALMATSVLDEAVNTRLGVASSGSHFMYTDNALGTGMWIAPIYKQHTSDSFDSDGLDYGAKIRMGGVSLGGDYSFANGLRAGLAVTIGKSDIDGREGADGVDNDSSFYGFALYGGYKYDAFSIAADIGYTKIKNSLDYETGLDGFGKISADADVTAYHAATTAQYEFDLGRLAVTPHAGLRFVSFDVDDYSVNSASGAIANTKNDRVNVFSVPVGVTLSHEFTNGDFRIKPAADLRVTVNSGDTDIDYKTRFIGSSADTKLNADIIDTVTYGVELGLAASYQKNLSFGVSANYTGSSDAKEFGFNLSSRYAF